MKDPWDWGRADLEAFIGHSENIRLEFKRSDLLTGKNRDEIATDLSKAASAFANTVGGTIVIGIKEEKIGKTRIAKELDAGTPISVISPEQLLSIVEPNLSPLLPGIRLKPIPASVSGNFFYVIHIPKGSTAYQAKDHRYYGRSEYSSRSLPDNEVRLRMFQGKAYQGRITIANVEISSEEIPKANLQQRLGDASKRLLPLFPDADSLASFRLRKFSYAVVLENTGEINISEFKVNLAFSNHDIVYHKHFNKTYRDGAYDNNIMKRVFASMSRRDRQEYPENIVVFPQDTFSLITESFYHPADSAIPLPENTLSWRLFLPDSIPTEGVINVTSELSAHQA